MGKDWRTSAGDAIPTRFEFNLQSCVADANAVTIPWESRRANLLQWRLAALYTRLAIGHSYIFHLDEKRVQLCTEWLKVLRKEALEDELMCARTPRGCAR